MLNISIFNKILKYVLDLDNYLKCYYIKTIFNADFYKLVFCYATSVLV